MQGISGRDLEIFSTFLPPPSPPLAGARGVCAVWQQPRPHGCGDYITKGRLLIRWLLLSA
jgi:hypothetical protein